MIEKPKAVSKSENKETDKSKDQKSSLCDAFEVSVESAQIVNYAAAQNNIPLISRLIIRNKSEHHFRQVEVSISANPAIFEPKRFTFDTFRGEETRTFSSVHLNLALNHEYLFELDESECATISVRVNKTEMEPKLHNQPIRLLARNEWGATLGLPELLAAHVQPTPIEIDRILSAASNLLRSSAGIAMDGYRSKNREYVWKQVNAIFQTLTNMGFQYAPPPASFEKTGQKIRTATQILDGKVMTCLDSSVLIA